MGDVLFPKWKRKKEKINKSTEFLWLGYVTAISELQSFRHHYIPKFGSLKWSNNTSLNSTDPYSKNPSVSARKTRLDNDFATSDESFACCVWNCFTKNFTAHSENAAIFSNQLTFKFTNLIHTLITISTPMKNHIPPYFTQAQSDLQVLVTTLEIAQTLLDNWFFFS